jgi:hypothetical protein
MRCSWNRQPASGYKGGQNPVSERDPVVEIAFRDEDEVTAEGHLQRGDLPGQLFQEVHGTGEQSRLFYEFSTPNGRAAASPLIAPRYRYNASSGLAQNRHLKKPWTRWSKNRAGPSGSWTPTDRLRFSGELDAGKYGHLWAEVG